jgi:predicted glycoside hydrolase/deacetylase ChbG (UPF0249 family)
MQGKLIITADDYGMCDAVNKAIEECMEAGALRATCVMANMPAFRDIAFLRRRFPKNSIGIHWNLTQGQPTLPPSQIPSLVHIDGTFLSLPQFRRRWWKRLINIAEVKAELHAQYERFYQEATKPDFWNTHQNVHVLPGLFEACVTFGRELKIPAMRCHRRFTVSNNQTLTRYHLYHPLYWLKGRIITRWSQQAESQGMLLPDGRIHLPDTRLSKDTFAQLVRCVQWGSVKRAVELVIHPATAIHEELFGSINELRVHEYKMFREPDLIKYLYNQGVETVSFEVLHNNSSCYL